MIILNTSASNLLLQGLIGQRYGDKPLPVSIAATDFEVIRTTLRHHRNRETRDAWLLDQFYKKDSNAVPHSYVLQSMDSVRENLKPKSAMDVSLYLTNTSYNCRIPKDLHIAKIIC